jgi:hypothetical protein
LLIIFPWTLWATAFWLQRLMWVAGWLRLIPQAELPKQKIFDQLIISKQVLFFCGFSLYVGGAVCRVPQEWLRSILFFGFALFFNACCGVGRKFSATLPT